MPVELEVGGCRRWGWWESRSAQSSRTRIRGQGASGMEGSVLGGQSQNRPSFPTRAVPWPRSTVAGFAIGCVPAGPGPGPYAVSEEGERVDVGQDGEGAAGEGGAADGEDRSVQLNGAVMRYPDGRQQDVEQYPAAGG